MRPDIDAGPIGRKCSDSNGLVPWTAEPPADWPRPTIDWAPNAAPSTHRSIRTRADFICVSSGKVREEITPTTADWRSCRLSAPVRQESHRDAEDTELNASPRRAAAPAL